MNVHYMCSWTVHEYSWTTNETFVKFLNCQPEVPSLIFMKLRLFMNNQELRWFYKEPDKPATLKLSSWASQTKFVLMLMNVHELFMKIHSLLSLSLTQNWTENWETNYFKILCIMWLILKLYELAMNRTKAYQVHNNSSKFMKLSHELSWTK